MPSHLLFLKMSIERAYCPYPACNFRADGQNSEARVKGHVWNHHKVHQKFLDMPCGHKINILHHGYLRLNNIHTHIEHCAIVAPTLQNGAHWCPMTGCMRSSYSAQAIYDHMAREHHSTDTLGFDCPRCDLLPWYITATDAGNRELFWQHLVQYHWRAITR
jgi:hypothetical protein